MEGNLESSGGDAQESRIVLGRLGSGLNGFERGGTASAAGEESQDGLRDGGLSHVRVGAAQEEARTGG
jgi:hypothetical protein